MEWSFFNSLLGSLKIQNKKHTFQKEHASFLFHTPYYSYLLRSILQTFINGVALSTIHSLAQLLSSITHKQKRSPTHAFLVVEIQ
jgi:hypothetical protein